MLKASVTSTNVTGQCLTCICILVSMDAQYLMQICSAVLVDINTMVSFFSFTSTFGTNGQSQLYVVTVVLFLFSILLDES